MMKQKIAILLVLLLSLFPVGCGAQENEADQNPSEISSAESSSVSETIGIALTVKEITPTGLQLTITHTSGVPTGSLQFGAAFKLERYIGEAWEEVPYITEDGSPVSWTAIAYLLSENGSMMQNISWENIYGSLPAGTYRLSRTFMDLRGPGDYDTLEAFAEFEIK